MLDANYLIFEKPFEGQPLFKSQFDLVQQLLTTPAYSVNQVDQQGHLRAQTRLKTYVSQLLSDSVTRTITEDFKTSLQILLERKIKDPELRRETLSHILSDLRQKNTPSIRNESKVTVKSSLQTEIADSNYVSIITANPISIETSSKSKSEFSLRYLFIEDLINNLAKRDAPIKFYRFSFPMETHCEIFWIAFQKTLMEYLQILIDDKTFIETLYEKFAIKTDTLSLVEAYSRLREASNDNAIEFPRDQLLFALSQNIIELLNRNRNVTAFLVTEPVYTVPILVLNPNELGAGKMYVLVEDENKKMNVIKSTRENLLIWKLFVWDKINASKTTKNIPCPFLDKDVYSNNDLNQ